MEQQIKEAGSFKPLTVSTPPSTPSTKDPEAVLKSYASKRARLLFGCYRKGDANDPDTYVAAITAVLSRYPEDVIRAVTHPAKGLPIRTQFLPTVKEVYDACEAIMQPKRDAEAHKKQVEKQIAERKESETAPGWAKDSTEAKAILILHEIVERTQAYYQILCRGRWVIYSKPVTEQLKALAQAPEQSAWVMLTHQQAGAWEALLRSVFDDGLIRHRLKEGSRAPWPWPPSIEGKIYDEATLANEGQR
jgi:hypothetical protein